MLHLPLATLQRSLVNFEFKESLPLSPNMSDYKYSPQEQTHSTQKPNQPPAWNNTSPLHLCFKCKRLSFPIFSDITSHMIFVSKQAKVRWFSLVLWTSIWQGNPSMRFALQRLQSLRLLMPAFYRVSSKGKSLKQKAGVYCAYRRWLLAP